MEKINKQIEAYEETIVACQDPEEKKRLMKKEEELREERLMLLRQEELAGGTTKAELIAKKRKSADEAFAAKDEVPLFYDEAMMVAEELKAAKEEIDKLKSDALSTMKNLITHKDEIHALQAERPVYLKAALKMFQCGIVEFELQVFLGTHSIRSEDNKQFYCGSPPVGYNCDLSSLMRHWRTCSSHPKPPVIVDKKQVDARQFKAPTQNVETALDNLYASLSNPQHFTTDYPIKLTPLAEDADTLALVSFLEFYNVDYCLLCDEQGKVDC